MTNPSDPAAERNRELDVRLGTAAPSLKRLSDELYADYTTEGWGLGRFASLTDEPQRAIASELLLSAVEGVEVNLREMALCQIDVEDLVGRGHFVPGGKTTIDDLIEDKRLHRAITDFVRALGSTIDCLAAVTIGVIGLPTALQRASGSKLVDMPELPGDAPDTQRAARTEVASVFGRHATAKPSGWLAWALEFRNAVVHRGHLTQVYLPRPGLSGARVKLRPSAPSGIDRRFEPHLRATPWQPDMLALTKPRAKPDALWLPEPAQATTLELKRRTVILADALAEVLASVVAREITGWVFPEKQWSLSHDVTKPQARQASAFKGFDPKYPMPALDAIKVHHHSAARLALAERLRVKLSKRS